MQIETAASTQTEAVTAYKRMIDSGYHSAIVERDLYRYFPEIANARGAFDALRARDKADYSATNPAAPFDPMDMATYNRPEFSSEHWRDDTHAAQRRYDEALSFALSQ